MRNFLIPCLTVCLAVASGQELLTNGDFEQDLTVGWTFTDSGYGTHTCDRQPTYHPDPDYEAQTYQYDNPGWARLGQTVFCPGINLQLSFSACFAESGGTSSCWPAACISICYYDVSEVLLGETRYYYSTYANWVPTPTLSLIQIANPDWSQYSLNVAEEIAQHLSGVDPDDVAGIEVALLSYTYSG